MYYKFRHSNSVSLAFSDLLHVIFYQNKMLVSSFYDRCTGKFSQVFSLFMECPPPPKKNESFNHKFISYNLFSDLDLGYAQTLSPESFNKDKGMQLALAEK